jgi:hypothetical protein
MFKILRCPIYIVLCLAAAANADDLLSGPESVAFDSAGNRYLVSNYFSGAIVQIDSQGAQTYYFTDLTSCASNCIAGDTQYVTIANTNLVIGIDMTTPEPEIVMEIPIFPVWSHLDGIAADKAGYLYVVDTGGRIIKARISDQTFSVLTSTYLPYSTQDCIYDEFNERLLVCCYTGTGFLKSVDPTDGTVTTLPAQGPGYLDGIAIDDAGNVYTSSHVGAGYISRYDSTFIDPPVTISSGHNQPAGLYYNVQDRVITVPNFLGNTMDIIPDPLYQDDDEDGVLNGTDNCPLQPNPEQEDLDEDGVGDSCDVCMSTFDPDQEDSDGDSVGDSCDVCPGFDDLADLDDDAIPDSCDNCPGRYNPDQIDADSNGVGDVCDYVCGDADGSDAVDVDDVVHLITYIFSGGPAPEPLDAGDADCSGGVDIDDAVYLITYIFSGGSRPCDTDGNDVPEC